MREYDGLINRSPQALPCSKIGTEIAGPGIQAIFRNKMGTKIPGRSIQTLRKIGTEIKVLYMLVNTTDFVMHV